MNPPVHSNRAQTIQSRIAAAASAPNAPTPCSICGSEYYYEVNAFQYNISSYGARPVSPSGQRLLVCVCGHQQTIATGATPAGTERQRFNESIKNAKEHNDKKNPHNLIKNTASVSELEELREKYTMLEAKFNTLVAYLEEREEDHEEQSTEEPEHVEDKELEDTPEKITRQRGRKNNE